MFGSKVTVKFATAILGAAMAVATMGQAQATPITNTTGIASPQNVVTFEEIVLPVNTAMTGQYAGLGVTFTGLFYDGLLPNSGDFFPNMSGHALADFDAGSCPCGPTFAIFFTNPVSAAAFAMSANPGLSTFSAFLSGTPIESFSAPADTVSTTNFFGFQGIIFDEIRVSPGGVNDAAVLDNIQFNLAPSAVPEPGTLAMFGLGLAGLGYMRRKRTI